MNDLDSKVRWGHSVHGDSIRASYNDSEVEETGKYFKRTVRYTSPHAWIVEHGGTSMIHMKNTPMPIGKQQGMIGAGFATKVQMQEGYHYLENAVKSITKEDIDRIFSKYMR